MISFGNSPAKLFLIQENGDEIYLSNTTIDNNIQASKYSQEEENKYQEIWKSLSEPVSFTIETKLSKEFKIQQFHDTLKFLIKGGNCTMIIDGKEYNVNISFKHTDFCFRKKYNKMTIKQILNAFRHLPESIIRKNFLKF